METKDKVNNQVEENNQTPQSQTNIDKNTEEQVAEDKIKSSLLRNAAKVANTVSKVAKSITDNEKIVGVANKIEDVANAVTNAKSGKDEGGKESSSADVVATAGKLVADAGKSVVNNAVKGGVAVAGNGFFATLFGFITAHMPAVLIAAAVSAVLATTAYIVADMNKPLLIENTANIVEEVKKISEFTTACYYEESVIQDHKLTTKKQWFGNELDTVENSIVLTVLCKVRAGYDLSAIDGDALVVKGDTVNIKLPAPKIFDVISNPSDYKIFEEIGKWEHDEVIVLQKQAKEKMLQNALDHNILEKANSIGKERIKTLFATLGFKVINVTLSDVPAREVAPKCEEAPATADSVEVAISAPADSVQQGVEQ